MALLRLFQLVKEMCRLSPCDLRETCNDPYKSFSSPPPNPRLVFEMQNHHEPHCLYQFYSKNNLMWLYDLTLESSNYSKYRY